MMSKGETPAMGSTHALARRLTVLISALVLVAAFAPASASAQGEENPCTATVSATQGEGTASFEVDCGDVEIDTVELRTSESGSAEGQTGTDCTSKGEDLFSCEPNGESGADFNSVSGQFDAEDGGVCDDGQLAVNFRVHFVDPARDSQDINDVGIEGCNDAGETGGESAERCETETTTTGESGDRQEGEPEAVNTEETVTSDEECAPEGGLDSGAGGTAKAATLPGDMLPAGLGAGALVLAAGAFGARRRAAR